MEKVSNTSQRKNEHLAICLEKSVETSVSAGFEKIDIRHLAMPELTLENIDTTQKFLGKTLKAPILISSMTGGSPEGGRYNQILAEAAEGFGIAMGVGSQRAAIEDSSLVETFKVRKVAPNILLFANLGAVQLNYGYTLDEVHLAVDMIEADAIFLHLNPLQEALQPEGNINFSGLLGKIEKMCEKLKVPIVVKEVGSGISAPLAKTLLDLGVAAVDCAGLGGTSWALVEAYRHQDPVMREICKHFSTWGITTGDCLLSYRSAGLKGEIIASGGLRFGMDVFKSLALGARLCGMALPFIKAAHQGPEVLHDAIESIIKELKIAMFNSGAACLGAIGDEKIIIKE